ncbi:protein REVEILLE 8-like [Camellia sinensis]|uniref:protein REVEILLE 8-like n=1 Tax=Camellia sinensis TaxID=4442 RepID=UPI001036618D|nr:protein REVEILLE 8-like [Camellia sinensis]
MGFDRDWKKIEDFVGSKTVIQALYISWLNNSISRPEVVPKILFEGPKNDTIAHVPPPRKEPKNGLACDDNESTYGRGFCLNFGHSDMLFLLKIGSFSTITSFHGYPSLLNALTPGYSPWDDTSMLIHSPSGGIMLSQDEYNLHGVEADIGSKGVARISNSGIDGIGSLSRTISSSELSKQGKPG